MMNRMAKCLPTPLLGRGQTLLNRKAVAVRSNVNVRFNSPFDSLGKQLSTLSHTSQRLQSTPNQRAMAVATATTIAAKTTLSPALRAGLRLTFPSVLQSVQRVQRRMYTAPSLRSLLSWRHPYGGAKAWILARNVEQSPWDLKALGDYLTKLNGIERPSTVIATVDALATKPWQTSPQQLMQYHPVVMEQTHLAFNVLSQRQRTTFSTPPDQSQHHQQPLQPQQPLQHQQSAPVTQATPQVAVGGGSVSLGSIHGTPSPLDGVPPPPQSAAQSQPPPPPSAAQLPFPSTFGSGGSGGSAGSSDRFALGSEARPLHVRQEPVKLSGFQKFFTFLSAALSLGLVLLMISFLVSMANPQSRLGGKSIVKEAGGLDGQKVTTRFKDVKGCDEAKGELDELVRFLRNPEKFSSLGGKMPKGVLLMGPPGTGKTLLAKAVAGEAGVPFFFCSGSEFEEMFVGVGARRVRDLFDAAKKKSPALIFIDEIDAVGSKRQMRGEHNRMTLNQLLTEMDGFQSDSKVIVIGATNFAKALDPALMRPGRFDKHVEVPLPDIKGRKEILDLYLAKTPKSADVNTEVIARGTPGCSGADLFNLVNSAAVRAASKGLKVVSLDELEYAKDKVLMGAERKSSIIPEEVRRLTAYHEGGHALMALLTPGAMPLHKATIIPRGPALGLTHQLPEERNMYQRTKHELLAELDVCMGGRVAEELIFGSEHVTTGASSDMERATKTARSMVMKWGMSDRIGLRMIDDQDRALGSEVRQTIDEEVTKILAASHARTKAILSSQPALLHGLAAELLKSETLNADQMRDVVAKYRTATPTPAAVTTSSTAATAAAVAADVVSQFPTPAPAQPQALK